jgi:hypothetical protein
MGTVDGAKVVRLADFRKKKDIDATKIESEEESRSILDEVSYHLVMAARAIAAQKRRH